MQISSYLPTVPQTLTNLAPAGSKARVFVFLTGAALAAGLLYVIVKFAVKYFSSDGKGLSREKGSGGSMSSRGSSVKRTGNSASTKAPTTTSTTTTTTAANAATTTAAASTVTTKTQNGLGELRHNADERVKGSLTLMNGRLHTDISDVNEKVNAEDSHPQVDHVFPGYNYAFEGYSRIFEGVYIGTVDAIVSQSEEYCDLAERTQEALLPNAAGMASMMQQPMVEPKNLSLQAMGAPSFKHVISILPKKELQQRLLEGVDCQTFRDIESQNAKEEFRARVKAFDFKAALQGAGVQHHLWINDLEDVKENWEALKEHFDDCFDRIDHARLEGEKIFIHCKAGVSRSPLIVIAYLMSRVGVSAQAAQNFVSFGRPQAKQSNWTEQLGEYEVECERIRNENQEHLIAEISSED